MDIRILYQRIGAQRKSQAHQTLEGKDTQCIAFAQGSYKTYLSSVLVRRRSTSWPGLRLPVPPFPVTVRPGLLPADGEVRRACVRLWKKTSPFMGGPARIFGPRGQRWALEKAAQKGGWKGDPPIARVHFPEGPDNYRGFVIIE
jgi:hypothetical protein